MNVKGTHYRTIWVSKEDRNIIQIIDQRFLPFRFVIEDITSVGEMAEAIREMHLRGAGLIGAAAGYGMYLAAREAAASADFDKSLKDSAGQLIQTRPTAVNLSWAVERQLREIRKGISVEEKINIAFDTACAIADEDAENCKSIGQHGLEIIRRISQEKNGHTVHILTHCNAGWLAFVDYGTALSPVFAAFDEGIDIHVWVDETRPRNQGARLTAWELESHGIPHTVIADNTGGHLMQHGMVDMVITGSDRTTRTGDVGNKIGTYLKALAARDNDIPFYAALPSTTIDWNIRDGIRDIPIENRNGREVKYIEGWKDDMLTEIRLTPEDSKTANFSFDVTPARLVSGIITERGICEASEEGILGLFPERA